MEIIFGNFLHSLRIPFAGQILSGIAVALITATQQKWKTKGLVIRAGLICAVMKLLSPGVNIFGPTIGIIVESLLFEAMLKVFGLNVLGYIFGGGLAVSWSLAQRVINYLISYGSNIVELYNNIIKFLNDELHINGLSPLNLILILFGIYFLTGVITASIGIYIGKKTLMDEEMDLSHFKEGINNFFDKSDYIFSPVRLLSHIIIIFAFLFSLKLIPLWYSAIFLFLYIYLCIKNYKQSIRNLQKPKFWIQFVVVTLLASYFIGGLQSGIWGLNSKGLNTGLEMNLRAFLIMFAFTAISVELKSSPFIKNIKNKKSGEFYLTLDMAFYILPFLLEQISRDKTKLKSPVKLISKLISNTEALVQIVENKFYSNKYKIITGGQGSGKTTYLKNLISKETVGFIAPVIYKDNERIGYDVYNICNNNSEPLCRKINSDKTKEIIYTLGSFEFYKDGFSFGEKLFTDNNFIKNKIVMIDEIGLLEAEGKGWFSLINELLDKGKNCEYIFSVRKSSLTLILELFKLKEAEIIDLDVREIDSQEKRNLIK